MMNEYKIATIGDLYDIPPERLKTCLQGLEVTINATRKARDPKRPSVYQWVDDGTDEPGIYLDRMPDSISISLPVPRQVNFYKLGLPGLVLVERVGHQDFRGWFSELYRREWNATLGCKDLQQINHSTSKPGVLRGLHFQTDPPQGKLVTCIKGAVWDVAVDLRQGSATRGMHYGVMLSELDRRSLWIPAGFAHGFCTFTQSEAELVYLADAVFNPDSEKGVRWDDPGLKISWPLLEKPVISAKDEALKSFAEIGNPFYKADD